MQKHPRAIRLAHAPFRRSLSPKTDAPVSVLPYFTGKGPTHALAKAAAKGGPGIFLAQISRGSGGWPPGTTASSYFIFSLIRPSVYAVYGPTFAR